LLDKDITAQELARLGADSGVVAIGETGLDYFRSSGDLNWQRDRFRKHIHAARETGKPLIVHCREAREDVLDILKTEKADEVGGVMHCFVEDMDTAKRAMDLNFYISFSGIVTFKNATALQQIACEIPDHALLIETDSPYLAPVPFRGKQNQPAYVRHVAEFLAELRGVSLQQLADVTTGNFNRLFLK
jgi:TatD DNase family protein